MVRRQKWIQIAILLLFVLVVGVVLGLNLLGTNSQFLNSSDLAGDKAPDFEAQSLDGKTYRLSDLRGEPVVLNFWASWCDPCRSEMPLLSRKTAQYKQQGLQVLGVNLGESVQTVKGFVKEYELNFPVLLMDDNSIPDKYGIDPIPTTFFIDREGVVQHVSIGELDETEINRSLDLILK